MRRLLVTLVALAAVDCTGDAAIGAHTSAAGGTTTSSGSSSAGTGPTTTNASTTGKPDPVTGGGGGGGGDGSSSETGNSTSHGSLGTGDDPPPNHRVAFFGDQGLNDNSEATLALVVAEQANVLVVLGDFDYANNPEAWNDQLDAGLPHDFPVLGVVGNHDVYKWKEYQAILAARLGPYASRCTGDLGVAMRCDIYGITYLFSGVGTIEGGDGQPTNEEHVAFLTDELADDPMRWRICAWHKNQRDMQVGYKSDEVGWGAYQACQVGGAMVATGHEHSYARTMSLTDVGHASVGHGAFGAFDTMELGHDQNFVFVAGLGGHSIRGFNAANAGATWWASYFTGNRHLRNGDEVSDFVPAAGVLFIDFHVDGDPARAHGYFKTVLGDVMDEFDIVNGN